MLAWTLEAVVAYFAVIAMAAAFELGCTAWERFELRCMRTKFPNAKFV